ncbi:MAG TPA: hypothetical protein VKX16_05105 [Chloroflexota bacterium]|nr:hypothetical protein [Chloroflexota bacterium]
MTLDNKKLMRFRGKRLAPAGMATSLVLACLVVPSPSQAVAARPSSSAFCSSSGASPQDTCYGTGALASASGDDANSAFGFNALNANTTGSFNAALGDDALESNTTGGGNTAVGVQALTLNTTGQVDTAVGNAAFDFSQGSFDTAIGGQALQGSGPGCSCSGSFNTASGYVALTSVSSGNENSATGAGALQDTSTGSSNTATGFQTLDDNTTGSQNTGLGDLAGVTGNSNNANTTGSRNTFVGFEAGPGTSTQLSNATAIGENALVSESNALVLGASGTDVGIGNTSPSSLLQLGTSGTSFGSYLQLPEVTSTAPSPPTGDCNTSTFVGRLVVQYNAPKAIATLWVCASNGTWKVAK